MGGRDERIIIALDGDTLSEEERFVKLLKDKVKIFKIGMQLFTAIGPDAIKMVHDYGCKVFLDLKYHDIPSTVVKAVKAAMKHNVYMLNVHASGGSKMLREIVYETGTQENRPLLLGVTVLTSMDSLGDIGIQFEVREQVMRLARMVKESGLDGVIASPLEVKSIRASLGEKFTIVTPGIRPTGTDKQDQSRIATPSQAIAAGSNYLVIGRPVTQAKDPLKVVDEIIDEIA
ncbi:orotidine-5'-phosphate decarboxylase [bacterium]|nr:orotidine-5'-phosphate decarboxylase [bacterium]